MPRRKKSLYEWWMDRINTLTGLNPSPNKIFNVISKTIPKAFDYLYSRGPWTGIKLSILAYYLDVYTIIAKKYFNQICYVDTFAGSGIVKIHEGNESLLLYGSPLLSILVPRQEKKFDRYVFIELDYLKSAILRKAIDALAEWGIVDSTKVTIITGDMNYVDYSYLLRNCRHSLVFVDPEGTEPKWSTINKLLDLNIDLLFNFMTSGIRRIWGNWRNGRFSSVNALDEFYGDDSWKKASNDEDLLNIYIDKLRSKRDIVIPIKVMGSHAFYYHILLAVRRTSRGNPWLSPIIKSLKPRIERTDSTVFNKLIEVFRGRMKPLTF